jgi:hypothetical protein
MTKSNKSGDLNICVGKNAKYLKLKFSRLWEPLGTSGIFLKLF